MKTLTQLEAGRIARGGNADEKVYSIGRNGTTPAGKSGDKLHVIIDSGLYGVYGACGLRQGGRVAILEGLDTDAVTCAKCQKWLAKM